MNYLQFGWGAALLTLSAQALGAAHSQDSRADAIAVPGGSNTLILTVEGVRSDQGQLRAQLLARKSPDAPVATVGYEVEPARKGSVTLTFRNLSAGDYAVQLFHDENDNGKVEMNLAGIPTEGFGFSNIAQVQGGIPPFERMRVSVAGAAMATAVLAYAP